MNEETVANKIYSHLQKLLPVGSLEKVVSLLAQKVTSEKGKVLVTLSQKPSQNLKTEVDKKIEEIFGPQSTVEYIIKPQIVGGFILEGRGQRYDYSLEKRIESLI